jgi:hypothetical protein
MHGEIRLNAVWYPYEAQQVIRWNKGFVWRARVTMKGLPVTGFDRWVEGEGKMQWKLLGIIPVITASGPDVSRSAMERMQIETIWLPSVLLGPHVKWTEVNSSQIEASMKLSKPHVTVKLNVDGQGRIKSISMDRWGDPDGKGYRAVSFGGLVEEEHTFEGYTIPSRLRIGWYFGTESFEAGGEFFRCTIKSAKYR